jgi:hypothetical protein
MGEYAYQTITAFERRCVSVVGVVGTLVGIDCAVVRNPKLGIEQVINPLI